MQGHREEVEMGRVSDCGSLICPWSFLLPTFIPSACHRNTFLAFPLHPPSNCPARPEERHVLQAVSLALSLADVSCTILPLHGPRSTK